MSNQITIQNIKICKKQKILPVWKFFRISNGNPQCLFCNLTFSSRTVTSSLQWHLESKHGQTAIQLRALRLQSRQSEPYEVTEQQKRHEAIIHWIIHDQQSFCITENKYFHEMLKLFDPR
ncbi:3660_t:CDS:1, partial [Acaulospora morrowiae]